MIPFEPTLYSSCKEGKPWVPHIALIYFQDLYIGYLIPTGPTQIVSVCNTDYLLTLLHVQSECVWSNG